MNEIIEILGEAYAIRALIASAMVGITCGVLGAFIVLRNMALIGDALSHAILPGVVIGFVLVGYNVLGFFIGSVIAALAAAILMTWIQRNVRTHVDASIGIVFTVMFAIGVIGISQLTKKQGVHLDLTDFLIGQILGISNQDLWLISIVMVFTLVSVVFFYRFFFITTFQSIIAETIGIPVKVVHYFMMLLLSFAVVASLRTVGMILVVAMLITPASTAYLLTPKLKQMIALSGLIGLLSTVLGLLLAIYFETTPGPAMVVVSTFFYLLAVCFAPQKGLFIKWMKRRKNSLKILREDILKQALKLQVDNIIQLQSIAEKLEISTTKLSNQLPLLKRKGLVDFQSDQWKLTEQGTQKALELVRAHRLWETYLVEHLGLKEDQIHEDAEHYEHVLTPEQTAQMDEQLGFPEKDPHGSPIPRNTTTDLRPKAE